ncbi:hypothetical protein AAE02nite_31800 [Adhaeribacter aerolatus]|uniref:Lipocalin-like domain-containing protein n=1 Tax=Adhaeribacter aerolatus TaxID=670289 RepID=A0A512B0N2_9BACT|nr:hypothetical protein [Adhaeribacter aerolatus]GEO05516.1 hypothetical protein AAE02nite_31800 [Adhaeribacter aerolatus]
MENLQLQKTKYYVLGILLALLSACSSGTEKTDSGQSSNPDQERPPISPYKDNFIGEWKSVQSEGRDHAIITRNGNNFLIQQGKKTVPGVWDEENNIIRLNIGVPMDIMYIEKEDMIVFGNGGKYSRVSKKQ